MEEFMTRGWGLIHVGCGGAPRTQANQRLYTSIGVSTPCGAVPTRGGAVFVPGLFELKMYGMVHDPGMGSYPLQVALDPRESANQQSASIVGISTP